MKTMHQQPLLKALLLCIICCLWQRPCAYSQTKDIQHVTVRSEPGQFFGWPANGGIWSWGNEILVQYDHGTFQDKKVGSHDIDYDKPIVIDQSRSLDGGVTWTAEETDIINTEEGEDLESVPELEKPIDFSHPDLALKFEWAGLLYYSLDRGKNWEGPYRLPKLGMVSMQLRTDYLIQDKDTCFVFWTMSDFESQRAENGDMVYLVRTTDGGLTWEIVSKVSRQVNPTDNYHDIAIMSSTERVDEKILVSCVRNLSAYPKVGWISCHRSNDNGQNWKFISIPVGSEAGTTPPALVNLGGDTLALAYGFRKPLAGPTSIRAKISHNQGFDWGEEIILREGGGDEDIGYTQSIVRPDGKIVTIYYWNEHEKEERKIEATIWDPRSISKPKL